MTRFPYIALLAAILLTGMALSTSGCSHHADNEMARIEDVLDNALDSATILPAISALESIPAGQLSTRQNALRALLTVQSRHKQHRRLSSDSLIFKEAAYFDNSSDTYHRMKWHFYRGVTRQELQDYRSAALDALHAIRLSTDLPDTLFMAKSEELLATIYEETYNSELSIRHNRNAARLYQAAGRDRNALFAYLCTANQLVYQMRFEQTAALCDSVISAASPSDSVLLCQIYLTKAMACSRNHETDDAREAVIQAIRHYSCNMPYEVIYPPFVGECFMRINEPDSVRKYVALCEELPEYKNHLNHLANKEWLALRDNDYKSAYNLSRSIQRHTITHAKDMLARQSTFAQGDYYLWQARNEARKNRHKSIVMATVVIAFIGIIVFLLHLNASRQRRLKRDLADKMADISQLRDDMATLAGELDSLKSATGPSAPLKSILTTGFAAFDALINRVASEKSKSEGVKQLNAYLNNEISPLKDGSFMNAVIEYANREHSDVIDRLSHQLPNLKDSDIQLIALRVAGFSAQSISILLGISPSGYYTKWHRLKERITAIDDASEKYFFLKLLK